MSITPSELTLFPAATPASQKAMPGSAEAKRMAVGSGRKCSDLLTRFGPAGYLVKTLLGTSAWGSAVCFLTWKPRVMKSGHLLFRLVASTPRTSAKESGLLPTPTTDSQYDRSKPYAQGGMPLALAVKLLPTPTASDGERTSETYGAGNLTLVGAARLLPTPIANDAANQTASPSRMVKAKAPGLTATLTKLLPTPTTSNGGSNNNSAAVRERGHGTNLIGALKQSDDSDGYSLNPRFVLEMMGFPADWCDMTEEEMKLIRKQLRESRKKTRATGLEIRFVPPETP